jgi:exopolysaccharide biosynthesis polyprenyl glycosylphosphotransferase
MKRKKLELIISTLIYLGTAIASAMLAIFLLGRYRKLTPEFMAGNIFANAVVPYILASFLSMLVLLYDGRYSFFRIRFWQSCGKSMMDTVLTGGLWAAILLIEKNSITDSRYYFVTTLLMNFAFLAVTLYLVERYIVDHFYRLGSASIAVAITTRARAPEITKLLKKDWSRRIAALGLLEESGRQQNGSKIIDHVPVVAYGASIVGWIRQNAVDEVFIITDSIRDGKLRAIIRDLEQMGVQVYLNLPTVENLVQDLGQNGGDQYIPRVEYDLSFAQEIPLLSIGTPQQKMRYLFLKRCIDIFGGLVGCAITSVLFVFIGAAIKLDSKGPVIFSQERIGKNGRKFRMYKFRSMYADAEQRKKDLLAQNEMNGLMFKMKDDPRITRVGKFIRKTSLDEFPQFFNVLKGDMSLVGTRPPTVAEFKEYSNYHKRRLSMKPGITGMWQVSGRSDITDFEEVVRLDCQYIDNWSPLLDVKLLLETFVVVLKKKGAG